MNSIPAPRPALRKAADAHIHPAAPGQPTRHLRHADDQSQPGSTESPASTTTAPADAQLPAAAPAHRLSGPLHGTTSDSLRSSGKAARPARRAAEKPVELTVSIPKSLRKEFREAVKNNREDADAVVASLLRAWLHG